MAGSPIHTTSDTGWKAELAAFFDTRGETASTEPSLEELCYIAGRDPRLWRDEALLDDLKRDIVHRMQASTASRVLEVGCAGGFLARLVATEVAEYVGIDLAPGAVATARRLALTNATFEVADGERLPFADASFDAAFCYDVYTNFPTFEDGVPLIAEMLRVVKPGGRVLVGSLPDRAKTADLPKRVAEIAADLERRQGPLPPPPLQPACVGKVGTGKAEPKLVAPTWRQAPALLDRLLQMAGWAPRDSVRPSQTSAAPNAPALTPRIVTYEFARDDFVALAARLGAKVELGEIHDRNPYKGYRFNAIYWREAG